MDGKNIERYFKVTLEAFVLQSLGCYASLDGLIDTFKWTLIQVINLCKFP